MHLLDEFLVALLHWWPQTIIAHTSLDNSLSNYIKLCGLHKNHHYKKAFVFGRYNIQRLVSEENWQGSTFIKHPVYFCSQKSPTKIITVITPEDHELVVGWVIYQSEGLPQIS